MDEALDELTKITQEDPLEGVPILILANKQDKEDALSPDEVAKKLNLSKITGRKWMIHGTQQKHNSKPSKEEDDEKGSKEEEEDGLFDGLEWLTEHLRK
jgi:signal recognition particle receptor subunit beta